MQKTLLKALANRYATKVFDPEKIIAQKTIDTLIESLRLTPTAYGLQLMKVVIVENKQTRKNLLKYTYNQSQVVDASHLLVLCRETNFKISHIEKYLTNISKIRDLKIEQLDGFKNMLLNFNSSLSEYSATNWMTNQVYIALGNLLTSCAILGIDACPIEGFIPDKYDEILNLEDENLNSIIVVPIGHSSSKDAYQKLKKVRRSTSDFLLIK